MLSCGRDKARTVDDSIRSGSVEFGEGGLPEGNPLGGGGGGSLLLTEPGPLGAPQDLTDYNQTAIQTWGPIAQTIQVQASQPNHPVQVFSVNIIETGDPFTPTYQLPSGTIVKSSRDPEDLVFEEPDTSVRPIVSWNGPSGTTDVFEGEILITFVPTADANAISSFITAQNLEVAFSWFRPDLVNGGNEIAWFQFFYDTQQYTTFTAAYNHFSQQSLAAEVDANEPHGFTREYGGQLPGNQTPDDDHFQALRCRYPTEVGSALTALVPYGPESGGSMSGQAIALLDDGVWRQHEDLWVHSSIAPGSGLGNAGKISWAGVNIDGSSIHLGRDNPAGQWYGNPDESLTDPNRGGMLSHGTRIAGLVTAGTNNDNTPGSSVAGVAGVTPSIMILPVRLTATYHDGRWGFTNDSTYKAVNALYDYFKPWQWQQRIRVSSMSWGSGKYRGSLKDIIDSDQTKYDRLYVGSAGNASNQVKNYPGAYVNVLGVSGLFRNVAQGADWFSHITYFDSESMSYVDGGSNYYNDGFHTYPVSGITDFCDEDRDSIYTYGRSTSPPGTIPFPSFMNPDGEWDHMNGTSACAPQVAALAALLFTVKPGNTRSMVQAHIISTRDDSMTLTLNKPLAGLVDYEEALSTW